MNKFGIGQPVRRTEDHRFLTGAGRFTDDISVPDQAFAHVVRSPHAHAAIRAIDTSAARAAPGVLAVLTGADVVADGLGSMPCFKIAHNSDGSACFVPPHLILATDRARHVGDPVALVVGETLEQARDAAERIAIDYQPLAVTANTAKAADAGMPLVWDEAPNNLCFDREIGNRDATEAEFAGAAHIVRFEHVNNRVVVNPLEPRAAIGAYDAETAHYTLYATTQNPHMIRDLLAEGVFDVPAERIRLITPDVGGGFGAKYMLYAEYALVLWAARKVGRPVRWSSDRSEAFLSDIQGRDHFTRAELALDREGNFLALRAQTCANMGAYLSTVASIVPTHACEGIQAGVYVIPAAHVTVKGVFTHTVPVDAYRGAGSPEATYMIERLIDLAAYQTGLDAGDLRLRNLVPAAAMPYTNVFGITFDSGNYLGNIEAAERMAGRGSFAERRRESAARGKRRGIGMACYVETASPQAMGSEEVVLRFEADDRLTLLIGTQASGQGHETTYAQIIAEGLGIPFETISVRYGDTAEVPTGHGTGGSRSMVVGGSAVTRAVERLVEKGQDAAGEFLEVSAADLEFADGRFAVAGTDRTVELFELAAWVGARGGDGENLIDTTAEFVPSNATFPNGCHICEVEIDPETGSFAIVKYTVVDDFGRVLNPLLLEGQVHGGVAQGIGQAALEHTVYDEQSGQLLTASFMDYGMPRASDLPYFEIGWNEVLSPTNPLGAKGAGEAGSVGSPPAVINAIVDGLSEDGVAHIDMPATPERVWRAIQQAKRA